MKPTPPKKPTPSKKPEKPNKPAPFKKPKKSGPPKKPTLPKKPTPFDLKDKKAAGIEMSGNENKRDEVDEQYYENTAFIGE